MQKINKDRLVKNIAIIVLMYFLGSSYVIAQDLLWKANFTGLGSNMPGKSAIDLNDNIYIIGTFSDNCTTPNPILTTNGGNDIALSKYDVSGNHVWTKQIGGSGGDLATGIQITPDGQYIYVTGYFQNSVLGETSSGALDGFLAKYKNNGDLVWFKNIARASAGVNTNQRPNEIKLDKNNNIVLAGWFFTEAIIGNPSNNITLSTTQPIGLFIAKFDTAGNVINAKKIETTNSATKLYTFDVDTSGYYLSGYYKGDLLTDLGTKSSYNNSLDIFVYKIDYNLNGKGIITIGGNSDEYLTSCSMGDNGFFYFGGYFSSPTMSIDSTINGIISKKNAINKTSDGKTDVFFAKYKYDGTLQWFNTAGSTENDYLYRALYNKGNFIAAGQYGATMTFNNKTITPKNNADAFAIVQNQNDNLVYLMPFGGATGAEIGETAVVDNNGNFVVIGDYTSSRVYVNDNEYLDNSNPGTKDMFVVKFDKASVDSVLIQPGCPGASSGAIYLTPTGTLVEPITYAWTKDGDPSFTPTTQNISNLSAGTYRVTLTDKLGYIKTKSFLIKDPLPMSISTNSTANPTCFGGNNGAIDIDVSGGATPYTYAWTTTGGSGLNAINQDQLTLTAGTYHVQVSDKNGCTATLNNITLTQPEKIIFVDTVTRINGALGSIKMQVYGGTPGYTYSWVGPGFTASTEDITGLTAAGNYTVTVTDNKSCHRDTTFFVADSHVLNAYLGSKQDVLCKGGSTGNITILTENVTGTAVYTWFPNVGNTATVTNLSEGNYAVTVSDGSGASAIVNITITEPASDLAIPVAKANITCYNANNGVLDANPSGGTAPYVFNWTKDGSPYDGGDETQINLSAGSYAVTVTDANNCKASTTQDITNPGLITFASTIKNVTCEDAKDDGSITLSNFQGGLGSFTFRWNNGLTSQDISLLPAGNYWVTVTDANNCSVSNNYIVGYEAPISISFNQTNVSCNGNGNGSLEAVITGGHADFSYKWSTGASASSISSLLPGAYDVTVTDNKFCTKTATGTITEPAILNIASVNQANIACYGVNNGSITLNVTGGTPQYNYSWDQGAGTSVTASNLPAGTFNVTVTDANNCTTNGTYTITQPTALGLAEDMNAHVNPLCNGLATGAITLTPSGGSGEYELSMNNGDWTTNTAYSNLTAGNYSFKLRDKNAITCEYTLAQAIAITQPNALVLTEDLTAHANPLCNGLSTGSITLTPSGGSGEYELSMNNGDWTSNTVYSNLAAGDYSFKLRDKNLIACEYPMAQVITITQPASLSLTEDVNAHVNVLCNGLSKGSITLTPSGGSGAYELAMNNGDWTSNTVYTNLAVGDYNFKLRDKNATTCEYSMAEAITITQPTALGLAEDLNAHVNPLCNGLATGSITLTPSGGSGEYEISLNNGDWTSNTVYTSLAAGNYSFKLRDKKAVSCEFTSDQTISITQPDAISIVSVTSQNATLNSPWNGSITLTITGGTSLSYTLNPGGIQQTTGEFTGLAPENYTISITDANNCGPVTTSVIAISDATSITMIDGNVLKIYPIPATDFINIEYEGEHNNKPLTIALYSITGKMMYQEKVSADAFSSGVYRIPVNNISKGVYILKINDAVAKEKVVIQ